MHKFRTFAFAGALTCLALVPAHGGLISFSGQFDPSLAKVIEEGKGRFDPSGAPVSVILWGSDSWPQTSPPVAQPQPWAPQPSEPPIDPQKHPTTLVIWMVNDPLKNLSFRWEYSTLDKKRGPYWDPAGYFLNDKFVQLTDDKGPNVQGGLVTIASLSAGDVFGFYVTTVDDLYGAASLTISGVPEPGTFVLIGLGGLGLLLWRRVKSSRN